MYGEHPALFGKCCGERALLQPHPVFLGGQYAGVLCSGFLYASYVSRGVGMMIGKGHQFGLRIMLLYIRQHILRLRDTCYQERCIGQGR